MISYDIMNHNKVLDSGTALLSCILYLPGTILSSLAEPARSFELLFIGRILWLAFTLVSPKIIIEIGYRRVLIWYRFCVLILILRHVSRILDYLSSIKHPWFLWILGNLSSNLNTPAFVWAGQQPRFRFASSLERAEKQSERERLRGRK